MPAGRAAHLRPGGHEPAATHDGDSFEYYPETEWRDDLELSATELYLAVAAGDLPAGLPHTDPAFYLAEAAHWARAYRVAR